MESPLLSVVMPVYNERETIDEIVSRVLAIPMRVELVVVDDCSTDGTRAHSASCRSSSASRSCCSRTTREKGRHCDAASPPSPGTSSPSRTPTSSTPRGVSDAG